MPQPLRMHQIRRVIEFYQQGIGVREIARLSGLSRNTIREYLKRITSSGLTPEELLHLSDELLSPIVYTESIEKNTAGRSADDRYGSIESRLDYYRTELDRRGVTRQLLWKEYINDHPQGYSYSQFCEYLSRYLKRDKAVMHFVHRPGEQLQVDFAGGKLGYVDIQTGEWIVCPVFICAMPYSHFVYAEALRSEKQPEFIKGLCNALHYLEGVPHSIKCDNMRTAVVRANRYEPAFTEAMEYMAAHYNTTILAARVRKPRDKASVEKAVDLAYKNIYAPLRDHVFHSLEELNAAVRKQLDQFNNQAFKVKDGCRRQVFEAKEKPKLKELPSSSYQIKSVTEGKVQRNYHVILGEDRHQYSVPYTLIGRRLKIIYTTDTVEIYDAMVRVAMHKRSYKKNDYTTLVQHMPERHQKFTEQKGWDASHFEQRASLVGTATLIVIKRILESRNFHEQSYNSCLGILRLGDQYGKHRLEAACMRIQNAPLVNYGMVANILKRNLDQVNNSASLQLIPAHEQIRGPQTYQ